MIHCFYDSHYQSGWYSSCFCSIFDDIKNKWSYDTVVGVSVNGKSRWVSSYSSYHNLLMNPVFCQKAFRVATYPIKSMGIILRKSSYRRRDFFSMTLGRRGQQNICNAAERNSRMLGMSSFRLFSTQPVQSQSNTGIYLFGVISGVGMMGGLYYYSSILKVIVVFFLFMFRIHQFFNKLLMRLSTALWLWIS